MAGWSPKAPLDEITATADKPVRVRSADPHRLAQALTDRGVTVAHDGPGWLLAQHTTAEHVGATAAVQQIAIYEMTTQPHTLEDVFLNLTTTADARAR